jgi:hypothetical protein
MKNSFLICCFFLTFINSSYSQTNTLQVEDSSLSNPQSWRDTCFGLLDRSAAQIPTGYLLDYSMASFADTLFSGTGKTDTITDCGQFWMIHNIFTLSAVNGNAGLATTTNNLFIDAYRSLRNTGSVPLLFLLQQYQKIRSTALGQGLFTTSPDSVRLMDVAGRTNSPYDARTCFVFSPLQSTFTQFGAITFSLPAEFWLMAGINSMSIDFGDGGGPRALTTGSTVSINYVSTGIKYLTAVISTAAGTFTARSSIQFNLPPIYMHPDSVWTFTTTPLYSSISDYLTPRVAVSGDRMTNAIAKGPAIAGARPASSFTGPLSCTDESVFDQVNCDINPGATVQIVNGCDRVFDKPIIIVEGFDPNGSINTQTLIDNFGKYYSLPSGQDFPSFEEIMRAEGYDFVYVTFTKNTDFIENNAMVLEQVIERINATKTGTAKNTVIGWSMGGLVARWALKDMEDQGIDHQVANYFSYDAPQQGANIPLGLQYIFNEVKKDMPYLVWVKDFISLASANASPAAREMLVTKAIYSGSTPLPFTLDPVRAQFAQSLITKGYPHNCNNYGISFGRGNNTAGARDAGNGAQFGNFVPGTDILTVTLPFVIVNVNANVYAVPENKTDYIARYRYIGLKIISLFGFPLVPAGVSVRALNFKYHGLFPYDDAPGGYNSAISQISLGFLQPLVAALFSTNGHYGYDFIPAASALDLQNQNYSAANLFQSSNMYYNVDNSMVNPGQVSGNTLSDPTLSPFQAVLTSTSDCAVSGINCFSYDVDANGNPANQTTNWNQSHTGAASNQTSEFMTRKILNTIPAGACPDLNFCGTFGQINGPSAVCINGQYQFSNPASLNGYSLQWKSQHGFLAITSGQGTPSVTATSLGPLPGKDVLLFTATNSCGQQTNYSIPVVVGSPNYLSTTLEFNTSTESNEILQPCNRLTTQISSGQFAGFVDISDPVATSFVWTLQQKSPNVAATLIENPNGQHVEIEIKGSGSAWYTIKVGNSCGSFTSSAQFTGNVACPIIILSQNPASMTGTDSITVQDSPQPQLAAGVTIVPNPSQSMVTISLIAPPGKNSLFYKIKIMNTLGVQAKTMNFEDGVSSSTISIADLATGAYIVGVFDGQQWLTQKLLVEK